MQVQGWKRVDVGDGLVATNFFALIIYLIGCVTTYMIVTEIEKRQLPASGLLRLSAKKVQSIQYLVNEAELLNRKQCEHLSSKLSETIQNVEKLVSQCGSSKDVFKPSLEYLYQILAKAKFLVKDCSREDWVAASAFEIQNENAFRVIFLELGLCYHTIYEQAKDNSGECNFEVKNLCVSRTFESASIDDVNEDRAKVKEWLEDLVNERNSSRLLYVYHCVLERISPKLHLAQYLLKKLNCRPQQSHISGLIELPKPMMWTERSYSFWTWGREVILGGGAGADAVSKTSWLGIPCAKKSKIKGRYFSTEAGILSHVNHPNIVKFLCCGNGQKEEDQFVAMELMETSLWKLIQKQVRPFSYHVTVDIMAQIARGMHYLHGLKIAHRDLKPENVVLSRVVSPFDIADTYHVKLVDFGVSKTQVQSSKTTATEHGFGTFRYKAPEVRHVIDNNDRRWKAKWFKADVWSFAITCLELLVLNKDEAETWDFDKDKSKDVESILPEGCPNELISLLKDCLLKDYNNRPDFLQICTRLEILRHNLLRGLSTSDRGYQKATTDLTTLKFIGKTLKKHFFIQRETVGPIIEDGEAEACGLDVPDNRHSEQGHFQRMTRMDQATYLEYSVASIDRAVDLVEGGALEFNENLCMHLTRELSETNSCLLTEWPDVCESVPDVCESVPDVRRVTLVQLYYVIKQAEILVQKCCRSPDSLWPERAFILLAIKEDILDLILHLRWWTSILKIVSVSAQSKRKKDSYSEMVKQEIRSLKRIDREFETKLKDLTSSNNELEEAALKDTKLLVSKAEEFQRCYTGELGTWEHRAYLLSIHIHSVLRDEVPTKDFQRLPDEIASKRFLELNEIKTIKANNGVGVSGGVSQVEWCGYDCVLKMVHIYDKGFDNRRETRIVKSLHHPHIVQSFGYWEAEIVDSEVDLYRDAASPSEDESYVEAASDLEETYLEDESDSKSYILMERMSSNLGDHIAAAKDGKTSSPFSNSVAIDIMLQVAKAVWHMHSKNVVHNNLKTKNILVRSLPKDELPELSAEGFLQVKVGDFGLAKDNVMSSNQELFSEDSFDFSIMCVEVLSGRSPSGEDLEAIKKRGSKPRIPNTCPDYLKFCISGGLSSNVLDRPNFSDMWRMIRFAKLRSLGLIHENSDLFCYKSDDKIVARCI
ncbi:hypothetical protein M758_11G067000 [Ceratodon purpureus]|nr:hypothetical protein M758_11G067000 [Ceratodon purpureus]KAG0600864.1 hypothetical protein M758_11G067000 [Ceratodon purpureus]